MKRGKRVVASVLCAILALSAGGAAVVTPAKAVDVSQLSDFENNPCFKVLSDRNIAEKADAPDSAMADACDAVHNDPEAAWARLIQMWQPRAVAGSASPVVWPGAGGVVLALLGMVLVYAVVGVPNRAIAGLLGHSDKRPAAPLAAEAALAIALRGLVALVLFSLLSLPSATALGCVVVVALLIAQTRRAPGVAPSADPVAAGDPTPSAVGVVLAALINDVWASALGLAGLVLLSRHEPRLLVLAVALAIVASVPVLIGLRRTLRRSAAARLGSSVALGAILGVAAEQDPLVASALGGAMLPSLVIPLLFGAAVVGVLGIARRPRVA